MKVDRFVTTTYSGKFIVPTDFIYEFDIWVEFEKQLDPYGASESTTQNGWQYVFSDNDKIPSWLKSLQPLMNQIKNEINAVDLKTMWVVDYNQHGYQDPHFHAVGPRSVMTTIINLFGSADLILQDPRYIAVGQGTPFAETVSLQPGEWISFPSYVVHNSRPAKDRRIILVADYFI